MLKRMQGKTVLGLLLLLVIAAACTPSPGAGETSEPQGAITVVGRGEVFGKPDQAQVHVGVETFAETVAEASGENEDTVQAIMSALEAAGIAAEDIQTSNYNLWAEQFYGERGPEGIVGYRVSNQVNVTIRDINQVSSVLAAVTEAGANNIFGVTFSVSDPAALEDEARAQAIEDARARARALADLGGVELGDIFAISEVVGQPIVFGGRGGGGIAVAESGVPEPSITPGQLSFQVQVEVTFNIN